MSNVVDMPKRDRFIRVCEHCHNRTWEINDDGSVECANCYTPAPDVPQLVVECPREVAREDTYRLTDMGGDLNFLKRKLAQEAAQDDTVAIVIVRDDSRVRGWGCFGDREQREWMQRRLQDAMELWSDPVKETSDVTETAGAVNGQRPGDQALRHGGEAPVEQRQGASENSQEDLGPGDEPQA